MRRACLTVSISCALASPAAADDAAIVGGEVIHVDGTAPPAVPAKPSPSMNQRKSLPYSAQAMERDAWALAWLLLEIDEHGRVARLKLLKRPGFDLDRIAIDEAWKLVFEPARDASGRAIRTTLVWKMEWPAWGWLVGARGTTAGRPAEHDEMYRLGRQDVVVGDQAPPPLMMDRALSRVRCAGTGPLALDLRNATYRDCSRPDLAAAGSLPWITRENATEVLAAIVAAAPPPPPRRRVSRAPVIIAGGATVALGAAVVVSLAKYQTYTDQISHPTYGGETLDAARERFMTWRNRVYVTGSAFILSGIATAFLWNRNQTPAEFSVQPTSSGVALSYGRAF